MTRGVRQIVRFNWPFYAGAAFGVAIAVLAISVRHVAGIAVKPTTIAIHASAPSR